MLITGFPIFDLNPYQLFIIKTEGTDYQISTKFIIKTEGTDYHISTKFIIKTESTDYQISTKFIITTCFVFSTTC